MRQRRLVTFAGRNWEGTPVKPRENNKKLENKIGLDFLVCNKHNKSNQYEWRNEEEVKLQERLRSQMRIWERTGKVL